MYPDGICLDEEGAIWVADPKNKEVIRIKEGGEITDKLELETRGAYACMLGGNDGKTLLSAQIQDPALTSQIKEQVKLKPPE